MKRFHYILREIFRFRTIYADTVFFRLFGYPVVSGKPEEQLGIKGNIFISEEFAGRAFRGEDPVGKTLATEGEEYTIAGVGVFADLPENTHLHFISERLAFCRGIMYYFIDYLGYCYLPQLSCSRGESGKIFEKRIITT